MKKGRRNDIILRQGPLHGSFTVYPYQVGIIICDGIVEYVFEEEKRTLPKGEVRTYIVSTAPFKLLFRLKTPLDSSEPDDIVLDPPLLTADGKHVTGRIDLMVSVITQGSMFTSVMPEGAHRLLQLLGLDGDVITKSDVVAVIKEELVPKLLALDLHRYMADELRSNRDLLRVISDSLKTELGSTIDRFGLQLDNFYVSWRLNYEKRQHEEGIRSVGANSHAKGDAGATPAHKDSPKAHHKWPTSETSGIKMTPKYPPTTKDLYATKRTERRSSALHDAAWDGDTETVQALLSSGADANAVIAGGFTALLTAAQKGHTEIVRALLLSGADANEANAMPKSGGGWFTSLHMAAQKGHTEIVQMLLSSGADANARTHDGLTPLDCATLNGHTGTQQALLSARAGERLDTSQRAILITINKTYSPNMTPTQLYETTRKWWVAGKRRKRAKYAVAVYKGGTLEVYEIHEWYSGQYKGKARWAFRGQIASREIRSELRNKAVSHLRKQGNANPILYLNC